MYNAFVDNKFFMEIYYKTKIENQTLLVEFCGFPNIDGTHVNWNVFLLIYTKRNEINRSFQKSTGKIGLKGLFAAKEIISKFESYLKDYYWRETHHILISWDDNRRRNIYERGLRNLGYKFEMAKLDVTDPKEPYKKYLVKHIKKES